MPFPQPRGERALAFLIALLGAVECAGRIDGWQLLFAKINMSMDRPASSSPRPRTCCSIRKVWERLWLPEPWRLGGNWRMENQAARHSKYLDSRLSSPDPRQAAASAVRRALVVPGEIQARGVGARSPTASAEARTTPSSVKVHLGPGSLPVLNGASIGVNVGEVAMLPRSRFQLFATGRAGPGLVMSAQEFVSAFWIVLLGLFKWTSYRWWASKYVEDLVLRFGGHLAQLADGSQTQNPSKIPPKPRRSCSLCSCPRCSGAPPSRTPNSVRFLRQPDGAS